MELLPALSLLLLFVVTFTSGQTDSFRAPDKFTARSFPQPDSSSSSRVDRRTSNRRNLFFPPPDRKSPTLRPILGLQGIVTTTSKPTTQFSRFHPSSPSRFSTTSAKDEYEDYDTLYYEYYDDYYDEANSTTTTTFKPKVKPPPNPPTSFSKFHTGNFRFTSNRDTVPLNTSPRRRTETSFRHRFTTTPSDTRERVTRPATAPTTSSNSRKGLLADLLAQLRNEINPNESPSTNDVDSIREPRVMDKTKSPVPFAKPVERYPSDLKFRVTDNTESSFVLETTEASQSIKNNKKTPNLFSFTTIDTPVQTTEEISSDTTYASIIDTTYEPTYRSEGKRVLEDRPAKENLPTDFLEPEGPSATNSFSSLFENIQIAVDPSLLPPGYSVEEAVTETAAAEPDQIVPTTTPKIETTTSEFSSHSAMEDLFSSLPQEDVTSLLPHGYLSSSTESISKSDTDQANNLTAEHIDSTPLSEKENDTFNSLTEEILENDVIKPSEETKPEQVPSTLGIEIKNVDASSFLPPGYKPKESKNEEESSLSDVVISTVDVSKYLPSDYKASDEPATDKKLPGIEIKTVDVSKFLPPGYKANVETSTEKELPGVVIKPVDVSAFLPPGYKQQNEEKSKEKSADIFSDIEIKPVDISKFLPPGYSEKTKEEKTKEEKTTTTEAAATTRKVAPSGIIFPKRRNRPGYLTTTTTTNRPKLSGPPKVKPKITNLFDRIKALGTTEYKVPVVTQKIKPAVESDKETTTTEKTTTTTSTTTTQPTTTTPPRPTTPGICGSKCRLASSLKIISGTEWKPELANRDTLEFQELANQIEAELDTFFRSSSISLWYDFVEIDSFNRGSVIVSYILSLSHINADVDTKDLKEKLNTDLERVAHILGNFTVDPKGTDFIVIPERQIHVPDESQNFLIPEWLIAVIVIGLASFLFILIFGVLALVSRARVRKRANVPLTEEFLNNLNALQVNGIDNYAMNGLYDMDPAWNEKYPEKAMKPPSSRGKGFNPEYNVNIYDSWRTDYSGPYSSSSANQSKRRTDLDFDGKQFYKDDPYDF